MKRAIWLVGLLVAATALWAAVASAGATANRGCYAAKLLAAGNYASCRMKAESDAVLRGDEPLFSTPKCDEAFKTEWARANAVHENCGDLGDEAAVKQRVGEDTAVVAMSFYGSRSSLARIRATGQTDCKNGIGVPIPCEGTGHDGEFKAGVERHEMYVDNTDGTVTDYVTGLTWEKKVKLDGMVDAANLHDADNRYPLAGKCGGTSENRCQHDVDCPDGLLCEIVDDQGTGLTGFDFVAKLNEGTGFAGYTDWRIPNRNELATLLDWGLCMPSTTLPFNGGFCGSACEDITSPACSCTASYGYWTSTMAEQWTPSTWYVEFFDGRIDHINPDIITGHVRAVRGGL